MPTKPLNLPVDLHAERMLLGAALLDGRPTLLGDLGPPDFFDGWNRIIIAAILNFPGGNFSLTELAPRLPLFARPYLRSLLIYSIADRRGRE